MPQFLTRGLFCLVLFVTPMAVAANEFTSVISVSGRGEVHVPPDQITLRVGVVAEARSAQDAIQLMSDDARLLLEALEDAGIPAQDVQTTMLDLRPVRDPNGSVQGRQLRIIGFEAQTQVTVTSRDLIGIGALFDDILAAGANQINGFNFGLQDTEKALNEARVLAVKDALTKAQLYADAAGVPLGAILEISDVATGGGFEAAPRMMAADAGIPMAPGSLHLSAQVFVTVAIGE